MSTFPLKIVTPDGLIFDGEAQMVVVRSIEGDLAVMARHINCVAPLGMGRATIATEEGTRYAACIGGMVSMVDGKATLVPTTFEWADEIDVPRADRSHNKAQAILQDKNASKAELVLAEARLKRALVRRSVASSK